MAVMTSLPAARAAFIDPSGRPTPQFYRFLETLATAQAGNVSPDEITAINAQLAELQAEIAALPSAAIPKLQVEFPILSQGLLQNGFAKLALNQPGDSGTGALKGVTLDAWGRVTGTTDATITGTSGRVTVTNGDAAAGVPTIDLAPLADSGAGTFKLLTRDSYGRLSGTKDGTTSDVPEGTNLYYTDARADARIALQKGQPNGIATLDANSKLDAGQLPALAITETFVVSTQAAMLALAAQQGDVCVRTDLHDSFILTTNDPTVLANWQQLETPVDGVASFNGRTGSVTPASGDYNTTQVTEGSNLYFTDARVLATVLSGLSTATNAVITAADSVLSALGKLQAQIVNKMDDAAVAASASSNAIQSIAPGAFQKVLLASEIYDSGFYDPATSRFTPTKAGKYMAIGVVAFTSVVASGLRVVVAATKNGAIAGDVTASTHNQFTNVIEHVVVYDMNGTTDYLELYARQDTAASMNITGDSATSMTVFRIGK